MIQLLDPTQEFRFEIATPQLPRRQTSTAARENKTLEWPTVSVRTADRIEDYKNDQKVNRFDMLASCTAALISGSLTIAFGYFLLSVI